MGGEVGVALPRHHKDPVVLLVPQDPAHWAAELDVGGWEASLGRRGETEGAVVSRDRTRKERTRCVESKQKVDSQHGQSISNASGNS